MIRYRHANWEDLENLLQLIKDGFSSNGAEGNIVGEEHRILFSYLYHQGNWQPDWVYLAELNKELIAAVGVFPRELAFEGTYLPLWAVSPVVTHPNYRGRGAAAGCLKMMFEDLRTKQVSGLFLWGIPDFYPKFGFVPVLPRYKTKLNIHQIKKTESERGRLRTIDKTLDIHKLLNLYHLNEKEWLHPRRTDDWWERRLKELNIEEADLKEVPFPRQENFVLWENYLGEVAGYLNYIEEPEKKRIIINDASVKNEESGQAMLKALIRNRIEIDETLIIRGTPSHVLNAAAYKMGGIHINPAPLAGMIKILDWPSFLNKMISIINSQERHILTGNQIRLTCDSHSLIVINRSAQEYSVDCSNMTPNCFEKINTKLTRLVLGLYTEEDLHYFSGVENKTTLASLFPKRHPYIWDANYLY